MVLRHQHGLRLWPRPQVSVWPLVVSWVTNINIEPDCGRTGDPDMVLGSSPGLDVTSPWSQVAVQDTQIGMAPVAAKQQTPGIGIAFDSIRNH